jgi:acyl-CoA thioester hydrolase
MRAMQEQRIRIRWRDMDNYGHVNNAVYLTYLEECRDRWARTVLGDAFDFVIVHVAIDYRRELSLLDEEVVVQCRGRGYGQSSIRTAERINTAVGVLAAESESVIVKHDPGGRGAMPLSDAERALLDAAIAADASS